MSKSSSSKVSIFRTARGFRGFGLDGPAYPSTTGRDERAEFGRVQWAYPDKTTRWRVRYPRISDRGNRMSIGMEDVRGHATSHAADVATHVGRSLRFDVELDIHRPPRSVRAWWTDLPDDYVAKDPREQPHRIRVLARDGDRIELVGTWRGPLGTEWLLPETLRLREDGSWTFDARAMGLRVHDEFDAVPPGDGTRLHTRGAITCASCLGKIVAWLMGRRILRVLERGWPTAAEICEPDAP